MQKPQCNTERFQYKEKSKRPKKPGINTKYCYKNKKQHVTMEVQTIKMKEQWSSDSKGDIKILYDWQTNRQRQRERSTMDE